MTNFENQNYKFRGGIWIGLWANSWPSGVLEFNSTSLVLRDVMIGREYRFTKDDIVRIEIKKYFPVIGCGIRICHTSKNFNKKLYFWYHSFGFEKLISSLRVCGWLE